MTAILHLQEKQVTASKGCELQLFLLQWNDREILHRPNTQEMLKLELGLDSLFVMWNLSWLHLGRDSKLHIFWHLQLYYACWYYVGPLVQHWLRGKSASDWITNAVSCNTLVKPWQCGKIITMWLLWLIFEMLLCIPQACLRVKCSQLAQKYPSVPSILFSCHSVYYLSRMLPHTTWYEASRKYRYWKYHSIGKCPHMFSYTYWCYFSLFLK